MEVSVILEKRREKNCEVAKKTRKKRISKIERVEMACSLAYLESMHVEMALVKKHEKIQRLIHRRPYQKEYVR